MEGDSAVDYTEDDYRKVFVSRIPRSYNDEALQSKFEEVFGSIKGIPMLEYDIRARSTHSIGIVFNRVSAAE